MIFSYVEFEGETVPCLGVSGHHAIVLIDDEYRTVLISQVKHSHFPDEKAPKEDAKEDDHGGRGGHRARFASEKEPEHQSRDRAKKD